MKTHITSGITTTHTHCGIMITEDVPVLYAHGATLGWLHTMAQKMPVCNTCLKLSVRKDIEADPQNAVVHLKPTDGNSMPLCGAYTDRRECISLESTNPADLHGRLGEDRLCDQCRLEAGIVYAEDGTYRDLLANTKPNRPGEQEDVWEVQWTNHEKDGNGPFRGEPGWEPMGVDHDWVAWRRKVKA